MGADDHLTQRHEDTEKTGRKALRVSVSLCDGSTFPTSAPSASPREILFNYETRESRETTRSGFRVFRVFRLISCVFNCCAIYFSFSAPPTEQSLRKDIAAEPA